MAPAAPRSATSPAAAAKSPRKAPPRRGPVRKTNWFAIWTSVAVVIVLIALAAIVGFMNVSAAAPGAVPDSGDTAPSTTAAVIDTETGAISFGTGPNTVDTYSDFMCPFCRQFEEAEGARIQQLIADGSVTLNYYPVSILDGRSAGTEYSSRAAGAMYAVAVEDPENTYAFMQTMYVNQPGEGVPGLTDEQIIEVARAAGVTVTPELEDAITSNRYQSFARTVSLPEGARGTPTLAVNGEIVTVTYDPEVDIVARLN